MGTVRKEIQLITANIVAVAGGILFSPAPQLRFARKRADGCGAGITSADL
jgi:hypothetical protein